MRLFILICVLFCAVCGTCTEPQPSLHTIRTTCYSEYVNDSFDIHITLPATYDSETKGFPVILYMDANLNSGKKLRKIVDDFNQAKKPINTIFVGIGHFKNYRELRRRDFVTPFIKDANDSLISDQKNFGQSENFYQFMLHELIPLIDSNYNTTSNRTIIGHSLGGLFTFYCLFKKDRLFKNFVSLSPSLWINYDNIYEFEKNYAKDSTGLAANLFLCAGSLEKLNFVLKSARQMENHLKERKYSGLNLIYKEFDGETHNSEVPLALNMILPKLRFE